MEKAAKSSVVVILYPGCVFFELALSLELLSRKYEIIFATMDGCDHHASNGSVLRSTASYNQVDLENCRAILIPGGDQSSVNNSRELEDLIRTAHAKNLWLAAISSGSLVLANANILEGKKIAHGFSPKEIEVFKACFHGVHLTDERFFCDGNIMTSKPDAHIDFAVEIACRLDASDALKANRTKDYYRGILGRRIRPLALALIKNPQGQFLFHKGYDNVKAESFYRPLGGGIEFSECGQIALEREIMEELNLTVLVSGLIASFENIFTFDGHPGHEIIMLFAADFTNKAVYLQQELDIFESGVPIAKAVWRSVDQIKSEGAKLYPTGLERVILG